MEPSNFYSVEHLSSLDSDQLERLIEQLESINSKITYTSLRAENRQHIKLMRSIIEERENNIVTKLIEQ